MIFYIFLAKIILGKLSCKKQRKIERSKALEQFHQASNIFQYIAFPEGQEIYDSPLDYGK